MPVNWTGLTELKNRQAILKELHRIITPDNYGTDKGQWSLTELLQTGTNASEDSIRLIQGVDGMGQPEGEGAMLTPEGLPVTIKLQVLSRQACFETKDGKGINDWDTTCVNPENFNNEICPTFDEPPHEGDVVWVKGNPIINDPETGKRLWKNTQMAMKSRIEAEMGREVKPGRALYYHKKFAVGKDGCITVPFLIAVQLLKTKGHRLVMVKFTTGSKRGDPTKTRQITNWLFKEAFNKPKDKPHVKSTAAVD